MNTIHFLVSSYTLNIEKTMMSNRTLNKSVKREKLNYLLVCLFKFKFILGFLVHFWPNGINS